MTKQEGRQPPEPGSLDEFARIALLFLRYQAAPQRALIIDLSELGFEPKRIAELLGTSGDTVRHEKREKRPDWPLKSRVASPE